MHMLRDSPTSLRNPRVHPFGVLGSDSLASLMLWYKCALVCLCCLIQICCSHWLMVESESARHISLGEELLYIPRSHCIYIHIYIYVCTNRAHFSNDIQTYTEKPWRTPSTSCFLKDVFYYSVHLPQEGYLLFSVEGNFHWSVWCDDVCLLTYI